MADTSTVTVPSTGGVTLAVHDFAVGGESSRSERSPLLLCHATGFHGRVWEALADELPDRRCIAPDFRGFGDSTGPTDGRFDWQGFADDVLAVIDHLALSGLQAVGHSKGGAALLLAELARPGTFDRIVCFEPIVFPTDGTAAPTPAGANPMAEMARRRRETFDTYQAAIERFGAKPPLGSLRPDVLESYVRHGFRPNGEGQVTLKALREHEARTYEMSEGTGLFPRLGEIACPVLVAASGDGGAPAVIAPRIAEGLPAGELRAFPELGHFGPLEDPVAFAGVVRDFLS